MVCAHVIAASPQECRFSGLTFAEAAATFTDVKKAEVEDVLDG